MLTGMKMDLLMDRPAVMGEHYIAPGNFVLTDSNGQEKRFDFDDSGWWTDADNPKLIHIDFSNPNHESDDLSFDNLLSARFTDLNVYCGNGEDPEIKPVSINNIEMTLDDGNIVQNSFLLDSANDVLSFTRDNQMEEILPDEDEFIYPEDFAPAEAYHKSIKNEIYNVANNLNYSEEAQIPLATTNAYAEKLHDNMKVYQEAEKVYGPTPEVWQEFKPKHEEIRQNIQNIETQYKNNATEEVKKEAMQKTVDSIKDSSEFFRQQYELLLKQEQLHLQEMMEIRKQLSEMQHLVKVSKELAPAVSLCNKLTYTADKVRSKAHQAKDYAYGTVYKKSRKTVHDAYETVIQAPEQIKDSAINFMVKKVTSVLDKGISFLTNRKQAVQNYTVPKQYASEDLKSILKLTQKSKLYPDDIKALKKHYSGINEKYADSYFAGPNGLTVKLSEGDAIKRTVQEMLQDGLSDMRIRLIGKLLPKSEDLFLQKIQSNHIAKEPFYINDFLKSDEAKQYRQLGLANSEKEKKAVAR